MRNDNTLRGFPPHRPNTDGWLGTHELPGYRAGNVVARLDDLPEVDPHHLYFDLLLLDAAGQTQDNHSGPCLALAREHSLEERSRFVRVVAELVRHLPDDVDGLTALGRAVSYLRETGVAPSRLIAAAQLLDDVCSEPAVVANLNHMLELSMGEDEARRTMAEVVADLARQAGFGELDSVTDEPPTEPADFDSRVRSINDSGLATQVAYVVRTVGKARARRYLREATDFQMIPHPDLLGA